MKLNGMYIEKNDSRCTNYVILFSVNNKRNFLARRILYKRINESFYTHVYHHIEIIHWYHKCFQLSTSNIMYI